MYIYKHTCYFIHYNYELGIKMIADKKRLALIDFYLTYTGRFNRKYICNHYGVGTVTASRDLNKYVELYPENLDYDVKQRAYITNTASFKTRYQHNDNNALNFLTAGKWQETIDNTVPSIGQVSPVLGSNLVNGVVSSITRAINQQTTISISYASRVSGQTERSIAPHSVFEVSKHWYVRAFDYHAHEFRTFKMSRITTSASHSSLVKNEERKEADLQWGDIVLLTIAPKSNLAHKAPILFDLGLHDKPVINLNMNVSIAAIWLPEMQIDYSKEGNKENRTHPLRLLNRHEIVLVDGLEYLFN
jgi:hypothetical protein